MSETMRKIPNYISSYIDESIDRSINRALKEERDTFTSDVRVMLSEYYDMVKAELEHHKGSLLNEFDSRLKAIGEYVDTKTTPEEVQNMIEDEFSSRGL